MGRTRAHSPVRRARGPSAATQGARAHSAYPEMQDDSAPAPKLARRQREAGPPADLESASGMSEADTPTAVRNAVSQAMSRIKREYYGKGPARARTYIFDTVVFSILDDVLTPVEQALKQRGRGELVRHVRLTFQDIM